MSDLSALFDETPQDEIVVEEPAADEADGASLPEDEQVASEDVKEEEASVQENGTGEEVSDAGTAEVDPGVKPEPKSASDEVVALRALLRQQNQKLRELERASQKTQKELVEKGVVDEPDAEEVQRQQESSALRASQLEVMLEVMRLNPKFEDVDSVVTQSRFDDMVEGFAYALSQQQGGKPEDLLDEVQQRIWAMPNPYRFMYEKIKEHHPDYAKPAEEKPAQPAPAQERKPVQTPTTVSKLSAGDADTQSGWTSARIDAMAEEELGKVPRDIYEKYLSGELK